MKVKTYNNVVKLAKQISEKGYDWEESCKLADVCFDNAKECTFTAEHFADMIIDKEQWIKETELYLTKQAMN